MENNKIKVLIDKFKENNIKIVDSSNFHDDDLIKLFFEIMEYNDPFISKLAELDYSDKITKFTVDTDLIFKNAFSGSIINDITINFQIARLDVTARENNRVSFLFIIEAQRTKQELIPLRLLEYVGAINKRLSYNKYNIDKNIHNKYISRVEISHCNEADPLYILIPLVIDMKGEDYFYLNKNNRVTKGLYSVDYYRDFCGYSDSIIDRINTKLEFKFYHINIFEYRLEGSILDILGNLYLETNGDRNRILEELEMKGKNSIENKLLEYGEYSMEVQRASIIAENNKKWIKTLYEDYKLNNPEMSEEEIRKKLESLYKKGFEVE